MGSKPGLIAPTYSRGFGWVVRIHKEYMPSIMRSKESALGNNRSERPHNVEQDESSVLYF